MQYWYRYQYRIDIVCIYYLINDALFCIIYTYRYRYPVSWKTTRLDDIGTVLVQICSSVTVMILIPVQTLFLLAGRGRSERSGPAGRRHGHPAGGRRGRTDWAAGPGSVPGHVQQPGGRRPGGPRGGGQGGRDGPTAAAAARRGVSHTYTDCTGKINFLLNSDQKAAFSSILIILSLILSGAGQAAFRLQAFGSATFFVFFLSKCHKNDPVNIEKTVPVLKIKNYL